jgi:hypothetical protein
MNELKWPARLVVGYLSGLALAMFVVASKLSWDGLRLSIVVALLVCISALGACVAGVVDRLLQSQSPSTRRATVSLAFAFAATAAVFTVVQNHGDPSWLKHFPATPGSDGILWQVQTTFLSVGFAGLAIAAQLFAEAPLAIGASRSRILEYVWAGWFVGVGLVANVLIAIESLWFPSDLGLIVVVVFWFVPTLVLLVASSVRLMRLFGRPSLLDEVVRTSLVETLASRLDKVARMYAEARQQLDGLTTSGSAVGTLGPSPVTFRVPVPRAGLVVKAIKPQTVRRAIASLAPKATDIGAGGIATGVLYARPEFTIDVEPGDRTRLNETAFRVTTAQILDEPVQDRMVRLLQSSIEFEPRESVTPYEETDREIANLKDTIGTNLRAGAYGTAERALELLGAVVRGVWTAQPKSLDSSRRSASTRRDWLFRSVGEAEQDAMLSRRAAGLFVDQAMARALEASRTGSTEYVDECLRSFTRLWSDVLRHGSSEFDALPSRITTCVQNLAAFSDSSWDQRVNLQARATWAMVELVKAALDARRHEAARLAARELNGLFEYSDRGGDGRAHVRAGQVVLSGWLDYLAAKRDGRDPADTLLRGLLTPRGTWSEILSARELAERGAAPFTHWDWWEVETSNAGHAQVLELSHHVDRAVLAALAASHGPLPRADDQETASTYQRFARLLDEPDRELSINESRLQQRLNAEASRWEARENDRLALEPLSQDKIHAMETALRETLNSEQRLAAKIRTVEEVSNTADESRPILGMNFRVPRHYLVDEIFNQTYADPKELGRIIARGFAEGEEEKIIRLLRSQQDNLLDPTVQAIRQQIDALGDEASHYVLLTPYGGLLDIDEWYSSEFRDALSRVTHVESAALDSEAILFDRRDALVSCRRPEEKNGLTPVGDTSIALGVFEDVQGEDEPQVRIETGEFFVVWVDNMRQVRRFALPEFGELGGAELKVDVG